MLSPPPVVFGEVLFDSFPDGRRVLGGAPFNVAWHLHGFGLGPRFVSRIGRDREGEQVLEAMRSWGMTTADVQIDDQHPTGRVDVTIDDGEPSFEIGRDQAYDFVDLEQIPGPGDTASLLYHGSLAIRSDGSWQALQHLSTSSHAVVCDLNLRRPWWTRSRVEWCIRHAVWLKMNAGELAELSRLPTGSRTDCLTAAVRLVDEFAVPNLVVTRGRDGVLGLFGGADPIWQDAASVSRIVDTVGAGDAFSAVMILGILEGWDHGAILDRAAGFASRICLQRGATSSDRSIYAPFVEAGQN